MQTGSFCLLHKWSKISFQPNLIASKHCCCWAGCSSLLLLWLFEGPHFLSQCIPAHVRAACQCFFSSPSISYPQHVSSEHFSFGCVWSLAERLHKLLSLTDVCHFCTTHPMGLSWLFLLSSLRHHLIWSVLGDQMPLSPSGMVPVRVCPAQHCSLSFLSECL